MNKSPSSSGQKNKNQNPSFDRAKMAGGSTNLVGEILKIENQTLTIKLLAGGSKIILLNDKTAISKIETDKPFKEITAEETQQLEKATE